MMTLNVYEELLFLWAGIRSVLCISCYTNLGFGIGIGKEKNPDHPDHMSSTFLSCAKCKSGLPVAKFQWAGAGREYSP